MTIEQRIAVGDIMIDASDDTPENKAARKAQARSWIAVMSAAGRYDEAGDDDADRATQRLEERARAEAVAIRAQVDGSSGVQVYRAGDDIDFGFDDDFDPFEGLTLGGEGVGVQP